FTSGSTGNPKGVIINHSNIFPLLYWGFNYLRLDKHDKVIQNLAFYFDWSVWEIFISLTSGSSLELISKETILDEELYNRQINKKCITAIHITPTQFQSLTTNNKKLTSIRHLCIGAEKLTLNLVKRSYEVVSQDCIVYNMYGPTEATIMSAVLTIRKSEESTYENLSSIPIGLPIAKGGLVILNQYMQIQPVNIVGELYISGEGLSIGYINDPEKTSNSFIKNIYKSKGIKGAFLYKTGDLARWLPDGTVEFLGRIDHQVKIRGFRIELGEIENVLLKHESIKESVVIDIEANGEKYLCTYLVTKGDFNVEETRKYLSENLPDYMIPSYFMELEKIPLNSNGKVNRKALPSPEIKAGENYVAPSNATEEKLVEIWSEVLNISKENISVTVDFFAIGGHSLKANLLVLKINKIFNIDFLFKDIFKYPILKQMALNISLKNKNDYLSINPIEKKDYYELSSAQKRMFIIYELARNNTAYNIASALTIDGIFDKESFNTIIEKLIIQHESLRTSFNYVNEKPVQIIYDNIPFKVNYVKINENNFSKYVDGFIKPHNITQTPLFRISVVSIPNEEHIILFDFHHIIADGLSLDVIRNDFFNLLNNNNLSPNRIQYKDFSIWQNKFFCSDKFIEQEQYWKSELEEKIPILNLPTDFTRPKIQSFNGGSINFNINKSQLAKLITIAKSNNTTLNIVFSSIYALLISKYSDQNETVLGVLMSGRNHRDINNIVGMFGNFLPVRLMAEAGSTFLQYLEQCKNKIQNAYRNQDYPFEKMSSIANMESDPSRNSLFGTMVNFQYVNDFKNKQEYKNGDVNLKMKSSKLDLKLDVYYLDDIELKCFLEYNSDLFEKESVERLKDYYIELIELITENPDFGIEEIKLFTNLEEMELKAKRNNNISSALKEIKIHITSSFTSDPIYEYIRWWGKQFGYNFDISSASYNQVYQELLDESSTFNNIKGLNILFIRFEDWIRNIESNDSEKIKILEDNYSQLIETLSNNQNNVTCFTGVFPISEHKFLSIRIKDYLNELNDKWEKYLKQKHDYFFIDFTKVPEIHSVSNRFDSITDQEGHIPFSNSFNAAIGTYVARKLISYINNPFKVIVLDCDNTLWEGVIGEDGIDGIKISPEFLVLQKLMIEKYKEGFLLTISSKNNEEEVWNVFENHTSMLLKKKHFVAWRINWNLKSENIKELAKELNLGIDSFIFIDDNPAICSEVAINCPEVLTLNIPKPELIPGFLKHIWAFDKINVTSEDRKRSAYYKAEKERLIKKKEIISLDYFLESLEIKVSFCLLDESKKQRASQLTLRTNQFNISTIRRNEDELIAISKKENYNCWGVEVADKFGEYGFVGLLITEDKGNQLFVDTFLLSCRVLGKNVENILMSGLVEYCKEKNINQIVTHYIQTDRNRPIKEYLDKYWKFISIEENLSIYKFCIDDYTESRYFGEFYYKKPLPINVLTELEDEFTCSLDHIAIAVEDMTESINYYSLYGYVFSDIVYDKFQKAELTIGRCSGNDNIELVGSCGDDSPILATLKKNGTVPYHLCFKLNNSQDLLDLLEKRNIEYEIIVDLKPAILFGMKKVMFIYIPFVGLIELLEIDSDFKNKLTEGKNSNLTYVIQDFEISISFFELMGYNQVEIINNQDYQKILLKKDGAGFISLINPKQESSKERQFLMKNGPHPYALELNENNQDIEENNKVDERFEINFVGKENVKHKQYYLPLENNDAKLLIGLPLYKTNKPNLIIDEEKMPKNEIEKKMATLWTKLLGFECLNVDVTFFELGGHSLLATMLASNIHKAFNVKITLAEIFEIPTIRRLAKYIVNKSSEEYSSIKPTERKQYYALSSAQRRLYLLQQMDLESTAYNMPHVISLSNDDDNKKIEEVFRQLIKRHESFRTSFEVIEEEPVQRIHEQVEFKLEEFRIKKSEELDFRNKFIQPFLLSQAPLLRVAKVNIEGEKSLIIIDMHHITSDGVSHAILEHEFQALFSGEALPALKLQYRDYSQWQNSKEQQEKLKDQENYWLRRFEGEIPILNLPIDNIRPLTLSNEGDILTVVISPKQTRFVRSLCSETGTTLYMSMLS
ncbi:MAG: HAD-IIIC family phosphatase, partial [Bacteroidales bacterium]|nr:HAD-IIIC family phosphatase [Bacteroidales bacterium]